VTGRPAVAIVILGAAVWLGGRPSPKLARRTAEGARQWHAGAGRVVVPCGGTGRHPPAEAEVMRALLLAAGVPDAAIHPETASASTAQNLRNARAILRDLGIDRVCLVSDRWHLPRARLIARRLGLGVASSAAPPLLGGGARPLTQLRGALREIPAYLVALLTGAGQR
jgi:uncharacterized SAM-binding protein YcdF (DUF218 family)